MKVNEKKVKLIIWVRISTFLIATHGIALRSLFS